MLRRMRLISGALAIALIAALTGCTNSAAQQSQQDVEALRKDLAALKKDVAEIRDFLRAATGGRFGAPRMEDQTIDLTGAASKGQASAPITLVEVSDYHCPFCRRHFQDTQPRIDADYVSSGKVRHVFIHYPIDQLHPDAFRSHEAAACANEQGKFWELHAKLFEKPARTIDEIASIAPSAGLDTSALRACMDGGTYSSAVRESVSRMQQLGVDSTPLFLIGKTPAPGQPMQILKVVKGAHPFDQFKAAFDSLF
jgi:protein-disulfide isomerase